MKKFILGLTVFLVSLNVFAGNYSGQIGSMYFDDGRGCAIFTLNGVSNIDSSGLGWFAIPKSSPFYKEKLASILSGKALGRKVTAGTTGKSPDTCYAVEASVIIVD